MVRPLGIGFVGAGRIVRERHVPGFAAVEGVELVSVATRSLATAERASRDLGIAHAAADWHEVVHDPDVDAVVVATWPDEHAEITLEVIAAGKHVLTEARMARDAVEARRMLAASEDHPELVAMLVPSAFSLWADAAIEHILASGSLGRLRSVRIGWSGGVYGVDPWRRQRRFSGNNTMALGIIYEALMRWVGPARSVTAMAEIFETHFAGPSGELLVADVPDQLLVHMELEGSVLGSLDIAATPHFEPPAASFFGTSGALRVEFGPRRLARVIDGGDWTDIDPAIAPGHEWRVEQDFVDAIRQGTTGDLTDFAIGVRYMAFTDAVVAAAADGQRHVVVP